MGGKKPLRRPLWPPTRATASNYYPLGLDGAGGAAKPLLRAPKKPAPLHGRLPAFSGAVDAFERARKCFLEWRYFFSIILSEFLKNRVALQKGRFFFHFSCHLSKIIWKTKKEEPRMCPESLKTHHAVPLFHFAGIRLFRQAFPISVHDLHRRQRRPGSAGALLSRGSSLCTG